MAKLLLSYRHYPLSVARFFKAAFTRLGHEVRTCGPFDRGIPWQPDGDYSGIADYPDWPCPSDLPSYPMKLIRERLEQDGWEPDAVIEIDAGFYLAGGWAGKPVALIGTDPHCLDYRQQASDVGALFIMQRAYIKPYQERAGITAGNPPPFWLPYAIDPTVHYWIPGVKPKYDVVFVGVISRERERVLKAIEAAGYSVLAIQGVLYEKGTALYAQGRVAFNLSTRHDLPMRFWEGMGYRRLVVTNHVPDLEALREKGCYPNVHYVPYRATMTADEQMQADLSDLLPKLELWLRGQPEKAQEVADRAYAWVQQHTYDARARMVLRGLGVEEYGPNICVVGPLDV